MTNRFAALIAVLAALGGLGMIACGSSGAPRLSKEEYFAQLQTVNDAAQARFVEIGKQLGTNRPVAEALTTLKQVYPEQVATLKDLLDGMETLRPPADVQDAHNAAIQALRASVSVQDKDETAIAAATTMQQAADVLNSKESNDASHETSTTCRALEQAASERGITVKLDC